jgi:hypothetical protein
MPGYSVRSFRSVGTRIPNPTYIASVGTGASLAAQSQVLGNQFNAICCWIPPETRFAWTACLARSSSPLVSTTYPFISSTAALSPVAHAIADVTKRADAA